MRGISQQGRSATGVRVMNVRDDDRVSAVALVIESDAAATAQQTLEGLAAAPADLSADAGGAEGAVGDPATREPGRRHAGDRAGRGRVRGGLGRRGRPGRLGRPRERASTPPAPDAVYTPLGSRATAAILALYVKVGACLLAVGADVRRIAAARGSAAARSRWTSCSPPISSSARGAVELVALVVALVLVARWLVAARRNLAVLDDGASRRRRGGAALWPVLAGWRPSRR